MAFSSLAQRARGACRAIGAVTARAANKHDIVRYTNWGLGSRAMVRGSITQSRDNCAEAIFRYATMEYRVDFAAPDQ